MFYFYWDCSSRRRVLYHTSVLFTAEPGLFMCICTSFHDYTVCHSKSCYHRGSQSLSHSLWFISPTCFTPNHCDHYWETLFLRASISDLLSCACVCIFVSMWCFPAGLPAPKLQDERVGGWGVDSTYQSWPGLQTRPATGPKSGR